MHNAFDFCAVQALLHRHDVRVLLFFGEWNYNNAMGLELAERHFVSCLSAADQQSKIHILLFL
jgi:hypothetical protein